MKQPIVIFTLTALFLSPLAGADTGDRGKARMERLDDNDDGQVTLDEFRMSARPGRMRGGMPGDGDGVGDVSIDELNAYLDAREAEQAEALKKAQEEALKGPPKEAEAKSEPSSSRDAKRGAKEAKRGAKQSKSSS